MQPDGSGYRDLWVPVAVLGLCALLPGDAGRAEPRLPGGPDLHATWGSVQVVATGPAAHPKVSLKGFLTVENFGGATARASVAQLYASTDRTLDGADAAIGTLRVAAIGGGKYRVYTTIKLARNVQPADVRTRYIFAVLDAGHQVSEQNENNNIAISPQVP